MALSIPQARAMLKEAMKKKYVGRMHFGILMASMTGNLEEATDVKVRTGGFDLVAPFTWMGTRNEGKYSVDFKKEDYIHAHSFKFGHVFYSVGFLPNPEWPALGLRGMNNGWVVPVQFVWSSEADAQEFADAFNRLLYAAYRDEEFPTFSAASKAWRENPVKPPLSPEVERHWILAENAIQEKNLDSAIEHYESAVEVQPMWPAGWFNLAMIYAEQNNYADATDRMKHYLELVPDAPDAKDARTQMIIWEDKAAKH
jgi:tetratricopeptide (TPR) repeat protein